MTDRPARCSVATVAGGAAGTEAEGEQGTDRQPTTDELLAPPSTDRSLRRFPEQLGRALRLSWRAAPRPLLLVGALQVTSGLGAAVQVLAAKQVLAVVLDRAVPLTVGRALPSVVVLALVTIGVRLCTVVAAEVSRVLSGRVQAYAICEVADAASAADLLNYERPQYHDLLQRAQLAASSRPVAMVNNLTTWLGSLTAIVGIGSVLVALEPLLVALLAVGVVPVWLTSRQASRALYRFAIEQTEGERQRNYLFLVLSHREFAAELRAFGLVGFFRRRLAGLYDGWTAALVSLTRRRVVISSVGAVLSAALTLATLLLLVDMISRGHLALSAAGAAAGAVVVLGERLHALGHGSGSLYEHTLYMQDFTTFLQRWGEGRSTGNAPAVSGDGDGRRLPAPLPPFERLRAEDVTFTYPSRHQPALRGVTVEIRRDEVVALVGENGSGKTTLAKVLAGLYAPETGRVRWDGRDVAALDPDRVRRSSAVIFQEFGRYWMSAADNIAIGDTTRSDDRRAVVEAARRAHADRFVDDLPRQYDNVLGSEYDGGANLSLGQWQRIALARAYFRDAPFVVLDEPTASLDPKAEAALFGNVRSLYAGRSVLLISHRLASCRHADRIYVLHDGRVVEHGSHDELMALDGRYAELFRLQATAYDLSPTTRAEWRRA